MVIARNRIKKILLIRAPWLMPPGYPLSSNFMFPLGLLCIASAVKTSLPHIELKIIDCLSLKIGWKQLRNIIEEEKPDLVGVGEGVIYQHEAVKVCRLVKEVDSSIITIAGGHFFSWVVDYSLDNYPIDFIVRFEGEETVVDLLRALDCEGDVSGVKGIAFKSNGKNIHNSLRPLIKDLDSLPMPAFDFVPVDRYLFWRYPVGGRVVNLEHSRGCIDRCNFCCMWTFWGDHLDTNVERGELDILPNYRTKSVERALEEVDIMYNKYNRNFIFWADSTFSVDPEWTDEFSERLIKKNYKDLHWFAYLRADFTVRDEKLGILEKMVRSGLVYTYIGVERGSSEELKGLNKTGHSPEISKEAFEIFEKRYPQVLRQATYILGLPHDTEESLTGVERFANTLNADFNIFYPLIYLPGSYAYKKAISEGAPLERSYTGIHFTNDFFISKTGLSQKDFFSLRRKILIRSVIRHLGKFKWIFSSYAIKRRFFHMYLLMIARMCLSVITVRRGNGVVSERNKYRRSQEMC